MKKLKKSIAVLLVLVMALTAIPFASAAVTTVADFNDASDVTPAHLMALDVLAAVNVLRGEDGNIYPQRTITRAEAATIVARVLIGPNSADQLPPGRTGFRDVDGVSGLAFASGAIAYLHERNIVIGVGDGLFDPQAPVTAAELAVMFLRAVGFGVNAEYTGPRWQTNAVVDGMQWRILSGDADFTAPATREEVFRYAFNAMNTGASPVGLVYVNWSTERNAYVPVLLQGQLETIHRRIFNPAPISLVRISDADEFGRPATRFTLRGQEVGQYASTASVTFTSFTSAGAVNAEIQGFNTAEPVKAFVNGNNMFTEADGVVTFNDSTITSFANPATLGAQISRLTGNGVQVEIFVDGSTNNITTVTVIRTDISRVTRISAAAREVTVAPATADNPDGIRAALFASSNALVVGVLNENYEDLTEFALDEFVLITPVFRNGAWEVGAVATPDSVTGVLRAASPMVNFTSLTGSLTISDEVYRRARILTAGARTAELTGANQEVTVLLDSFGFVVHTTTAAASTRELMLVNITNLTTIQNNEIRPMIRGFYPDGTAIDLILASGAAIPTPGAIVEVIRDGNDVRVVEAAAGTVPATGSSFATVASLDTTTNITAGQPAITVGGRLVAISRDAKYFYWDRDAANGAGRFTVRDRDHTIENIVAGEILAVVEFKGTNATPIVTALRINRAATAVLDGDSLRFLRAGVQRQDIIDGQVHGFVRMYDLTGSMTEVALNNPRDGIFTNSRWVQATADDQGRFNTFNLADQIGSNLGIFTAAAATRNGLASGALVVTSATVMTDDVALSTVVTLNTSTSFFDLTRFGASAVSDISSLNDLLAASTDPNAPVRVSIVFDSRNANLVSAIFVH